MYKNFVLTFSLCFGLWASVAVAQQAVEENPAEKTNQEAEQDDDKITLKDFDGTWQVETIEFAGQKSPPQAGAPEVLKISEGTLDTMTGDKPLETFSQLKMLIKEAEPMQLDLIRGREGDQGTLPCIFKFEEDRVIIAMPMVPVKDGPDIETARPDNFDSATGRFLVLTAVKKKEEDN